MNESKYMKVEMFRNFLGLYGFSKFSVPIDNMNKTAFTMEKFPSYHIFLTGSAWDIQSD